MTKKATSVSAADTDGGSGEDKHSGSKGAERTKDGTTEKRPLCNGGGQREELLCLWQIWAYGLTL